MNRMIAVAMLAAGRIGALLVPINTFYQADEIAWTLRHADVHTLITVPRLLSHDYIARLEEAVPGLREARGSARVLLFFVLCLALGASIEDTPAGPRIRWKST